MFPCADLAPRAESVAFLNARQWLRSSLSSPTIHSRSFRKIPTRKSLPSDSSLGEHPSLGLAQARIAMLETKFRVQGAARFF
jgi:hypothetical protein